MKPKISVVIPAYNEEKYIGKCLASLQKQTFKDFEVIVVDNNCTDKTAEIAKTYGVRVIREKVQGMIPARERGFAQAQAEIIARTDADTRVPSNWLSRIYRHFRLHDNLVGLTGGFYFQQKSKMQNRFLQKFIDGYMSNMKFVLGHYPLNGPNYAVRKSVWEKILAHKDDKLVHEDIDLSCHLFDLGEIRYVKDLRVNYSLRRWKRNFWKTTLDYSKRVIQTVVIHQPKINKYKKYIKIPKR